MPPPKSPDQIFMSLFWYFAVVSGYTLHYSSWHSTYPALYSGTGRTLWTVLLVPQLYTLV